jgi:hypothetical protein
MNERFSLGKVLGTGFRVWGTNIVPFVLLTTLIFSPLIIWTATIVAPSTPNLHSFENFQKYVAGVAYLLQTLVSAALTYGVVMELQGQRAGMGKCMAVGLGRFFPALGVGLLTLLCVVLGVFAILIGAFIMLCMLYVSVPASVIERPGIIGALKRSRTLTENHRLEIFGLIVIMALLQNGAEKLLENSIKIQSMSDLRTFMFALMGLIVVIGSLGSVMNAVAYYYLRQEKEGTSAAELAKVFE